jgi:hypothetical protein
VGNEWRKAESQNTDPVGECDALILDPKRIDFVLDHFATAMTATTMKVKTNRGGTRCVQIKSPCGRENENRDGRHIRCQSCTKNSLIYGQFQGQMICWAAWAMQGSIVTGIQTERQHTLRGVGGIAHAWAEPSRPKATQPYRTIKWVCLNRAAYD